MAASPDNMDTRTHEKANTAIALTLRYGALTSTLVMALGVGLLLLHGPLPSLTAAPSSARGLSWIELRRLEPEAVIRAGILLLLLTPVFRIVVAAVGFALERDFRYLLVSLGVLGVVLASIGFAVG